MASASHSDPVILFDMDDTLFEERDYVLSGFRAVAAFLEQSRDLPAKYSYPSMQAFLELEGRGRVFDRIIERFEIRGADGLVADCVHVYRNHVPDIGLYPGAREMLATLKASFRLGLVTNGLGLMQRRKFDALALSDYFDATFYCDEIGAPKPHPCGLEAALSQLSGCVETAWMVGDNPETDGAAAAALGIRFIRVKTQRFEHVATPTGAMEINGVTDLLSLGIVGS
jgi:putative hydrolase of the HAD superfamily